MPSVIKKQSSTRTEQTRRHVHRRSSHMTASHGKTSDQKAPKSIRNASGSSMDVDNSVEVIDLCTPVTDTAPVMSILESIDRMVVSPSTAVVPRISSDNGACYSVRTLTPNSERHAILPAFPAPSDDKRPPLLLANVPDHLLAPDERTRRRSQKHRPPFHVIGAPPESILVNTNVPSFFWPFYQTMFLDVVEHLHVDICIVDYNYARLTKCIDIWALENINRFNKQSHEVTLDEGDYAVALEFFLQIDVDLFYMKTCSFRGARPDTANRYLFCESDPQARYALTECGNCGLCYPKYDVKRRGSPPVNFGPAQRHRFVNGYEAILNCPCSCDTRNVIYVLTCPCGKFDYIGETGASLADRLAVHRYHGNRVMHEYFIGKKNFKLTYPNVVKSDEVLSKDSMQLYQHSTQCPVAVQMFLDVNPQYWRFVPMPVDEANQADQNMYISSKDIKATDTIRTESEIKVFISNLPPPPPDYRFSSRQYHHQYFFFQMRRDALTMPNTHLDLYNASVIAVLPERRSRALRQLVEALLITHAETELNSSGRLVKTEIKRASTDGSVLWCHGLVRRPSPTFHSNVPAMKTT